MSDKDVLADCFVLDEQVVFTITKLEEHLISFNIQIVYSGDHVLLLPQMVVHPLHLVPVLQGGLLQLAPGHPVRREEKKQELQDEILNHQVGSHFSVLTQNSNGLIVKGKTRFLLE